MAAWRWIDRLVDVGLKLAPIGRSVAKRIRDRRAGKRDDPLDAPLQTPAEVERRRRER